MCLRPSLNFWDFFVFQGWAMMKGKYPRHKNGSGDDEDCTEEKEQEEEEEDCGSLKTAAGEEC